MADPKYASLPGIDIESKDMYECGDLPEDDQNWKPEELQSTSVEKIDLDTQAAFEKFTGKYLRHKSKAVVTGITGDEEETVLQKYNRLKIELAGLEKQVASIKNAKNQGAVDVKLVENVKNLEKQLTNSSLKDFQNSYLEQEVDVEKALNSIKTIKDKAKTSEKPKKSEGSFEIYLKQQPEERSIEKLFQLEQRLNKLETTVGLDKGISKNTLADTSQTSSSLTEAVELMETKLGLLDSEKLPLIDTRLQSILVKINEINKIKKSETAAENNIKVNELYSMVQKWDTFISALPKFQKRLLDLSIVQGKACSFLKNLQHLEDVQQQITSKLDQTEDCQKNLEEIIKNNLTTIQGNIKELNQRFDNLSE